MTDKEKQFVMSKDLQKLDKKAKEALEEAKHLKYSYNREQKKIRKKALKNFDDSALPVRKKLIERIGDLKTELKEAKKQLKGMHLNFKRDRRVITKTVYKDNKELQSLKQKAKESWDKVHKLYKEFNIKFKEEHNKWNQN